MLFFPSIFLIVSLRFTDQHVAASPPGSLISDENESITAKGIPESLNSISIHSPGKKVFIEEYYSTCPPRRLDCRKCPKDPRCCSPRRPWLGHQYQEINDNGRSEMIDYQTRWEACPLHYLNCHKCPKDPCCLPPPSPPGSEDTSCKDTSSNPRPSSPHTPLHHRPDSCYLSPSAHCICPDNQPSIANPDPDPYPTRCPAQCGSLECHPMTASSSSRFSSLCGYRNGFRARNASVSDESIQIRGTDFITGSLVCG